MKINGIQVKSSNYEFIVIPRPEFNIIFKAEAIQDMEAFDRLVPDPVAGTRMLPGGVMEKDTSNQSYKMGLEYKNTRRYHYIIINTLKFAATGTNPLEPIEWENVKFNNPDTWHLWEQELKDMGLHWKEIDLIRDGCFTANSLNSEKLEEARMRFLVSLAVQRNEQLSQTAEQ